METPQKNQCQSSISGHNMIQNPREVLQFVNYFSIFVLKKAQIANNELSAITELVCTLYPHLGSIFGNQVNQIIAGLALLIRFLI